MSPEKFSTMVDNVIREQQLKKKLALLKEAKEMGYHSEAEFKEFLRKKKDSGDVPTKKANEEVAEIAMIE
jgi:hypothetical protein